VLLNGDDVFDPAVLKNLIESRHFITMVIDKKAKYDEDDMKVTIEGYRITCVGKTIPVAEADGESIGMILFKGKGREIMRRTLDRMVRFTHYRNAFYLAAIQKIIDDGIPVNYVECGEDQWAEIDFHPDLSFIRQNMSNFSDIMSAWKE
jgi:choline kinase